MDIFSDKEDNAVVIIDERTNSDPNMQILDSYKIKNKSQQEEIVTIMYIHNKFHPVEPAWNRTIDSMIKEWKLHNFAHSWRVKRDRTADCDFNNADEGKGFWDFVGR